MTFDKISFPNTSSSKVAVKNSLVDKTNNSQGVIVGRCINQSDEGRKHPIEEPGSRNKPNVISHHFLSQYVKRSALD